MTDMSIRSRQRSFFAGAVLVSGALLASLVACGDTSGEAETHVARTDVHIRVKGMVQKLGIT